MKHTMFKLVDGYVTLLRPFPTLTRKTALAFSIKKWEFVVEQLEDGKRVTKDDGVVTCGLCQVYWKLDTCTSCPVKEATGLDACEGTPYDEWHDEIWKPWKDKPSLLKAAKAELAFLRGLKP